MTNDVSAVEQVTGVPESDISEKQIADYLRNHPKFFANQEDLLANLSLPHESGKAISLVERQVAILRDRGIEARG